MDETQEYFIDILKIVPNDSIYYIQSPHEEILSIINTMNPQNETVFKVIVLTEKNKEILIQATIDKHIEDFIQQIEIKSEDKLIFEGYDGMEYGEISNQINLAKEFVEKFVKGKMCIVSTTW